MGSLGVRGFPIPIVNCRPVSQRYGVVRPLNAVSFASSVNGGLQPVAAEVVIILGLDLAAVNFAQRDVGFHLFEPLQVPT